ncbi:L-ascorbate peroxidase 3-like [Cajanus cajan]|uniref:L-ascorbate peroxidase 3-like n=1 Tax=Cajanus cajan TaxID=3821 RepID=UPI00098DCD1E|nr:L-ascorbate peroxidase 3-like [Cajanus cajan]
MEKTPVDDEYLKEIDKARRELRALIYNERCASLMLRLAWQDACTYDPESKIKGGPNGSIKSDQELGRQENGGLSKAVKLCEEVKAKLKKVSYADLYQLAGVVAVEVTGGPTIHFLPGREDSLEPPQEGRHPHPEEKSASHLRDIFTTRMGLTDQDIVALFGSHTLGKDDHFGKGKWIGNLKKFDNSYFVELLKKDASLLKVFPADIALVEDKKFRNYVEMYAKDEDVFFKDYAAAHKKFCELGCNLDTSIIPKVPPEKLKLIMPKVKGVIGIVIVSTATLGYLRRRKNNQLKK